MCRQKSRDTARPPESEERSIKVSRVAEHRLSAEDQGEGDAAQRPHTVSFPTVDTTLYSAPVAPRRIESPSK